MAATTDLVVFRGRSFDFDFEVRTESAPLDLSDDGVEIYFTVKSGARATAKLIELKLSTDGVTLQDAPNGFGHIAGAPTLTETLAAGTYYWDLTLTFADGRRITPEGLIGRFIIAADYTRAAA